MITAKQIKVSITLLTTTLTSLFILTQKAQAITYKEYKEGVKACADEYLSPPPNYTQYSGCVAGYAVDWVSMVVSPFASLNNTIMTFDSDILLASTVTSPLFPSSTSPLNVFLLNNTESSTGFAAQDDWISLGSFNAVAPGQWDIEVDATLFEPSNPTNPGSFLAFSFESDADNFQEMSDSEKQNFGLQFVYTKPVPEPLTILGAGTAVAFGAGFKRKLKRSNSIKK